MLEIRTISACHGPLAGTHHLRIANTLAGRYEWSMARENADMGDLLDALNAAAAWRLKPEIAVDQAAGAFQTASRRVGEADVCMVR
jgi:hypothetical protein